MHEHAGAIAAKTETMRRNLFLVSSNVECQLCVFLEDDGGFERGIDTQVEL